MNVICDLFRKHGFIIEPIDTQNKRFVSFIAYTERHCIVATVFEAYEREEQCACATFNPTFLAEVRSKYSKISDPGFEAYIDAGSADGIPTLTGPHNHDTSVYEIESWLNRVYTNVGKTSTFI